ncbi:hypothetical protein [Paraburkholderia dipogonis]|uniref:hypothetical protein n=1 Tax=Paraburkholderia dipogonis TaxID=1211383 RepID=UPI0038BAA8E3
MNNNRRHKHPGQSRTPPIRIVPRPPPLPALTDEAAAQIQQLLSDWLLWFSCAYGDQIQRCKQPWAAPVRHHIDDPF